MLDIFWKQLKSGSDIRGVATDEVPGEKINLTNEAVEKIILAFSMLVAQKANLGYPSITVAIGHDSRTSAVRIKSAAINAFRSIGVNVYDCSLCSTPAMFMATSVLGCSAAVQITASHHPSNRNGFKFFTPEGGLSENDIEELLNIAKCGEFPPLMKKGKVRSINLMNYYCDKLRKVIKDGINSQDNEKPLKNLKICVDAGNGAGGFFVKDVLNPLGADTSGSVFLEPDGTFPNHMPNPENEEAMKCISEVTVKSGSDLGIIFDTDVDRASVVDFEGKAISKNKLIAFVSAIVLKDSPGAMIVTDSVTSDYLKTFIENLGGSQFRYKRGYHNVISMAKKINQQGAECPLAIETSGHAAFKENDFVDDGAYLAAKIIIKMVKLRKAGQNISDVIESLKDAQSRISVKIPIKSEDIFNASQKILEDLKIYAKSKKMFKLSEDNIEGVRINISATGQKGWVLLRQSIHDPILVLYAESYDDNGVAPLVNSLKEFLDRYEVLDLQEFNKFK